MGNVSASIRYAGGLAGINHESAKIYKSYSKGKPSCPEDKGGLTAFNSSTITDCFWDKTTSAITTSKGGTGLTTAEMKDLKKYLIATWDFMDETHNGTLDIWGINSSDNSGYPFLQWQGYSNEALACQAPITSPANILVENIELTSFEIDSIVNTGYSTDGYVIYINYEDTWVIPTDGTTPTANTVWQNSGQQCIYVGTSQKPNTVITGLSPSTSYYLKVYGYNDCSSSNMYEQTGAGINQYTKFNNTLPSGEGSEENPYIIANLDNLMWVMYNNSSWDKHFIQIADIDARTTIDWGEFTPIGNSTTKFTGTYNGKGHTVDSLLINSSLSYIGLFGYTTESVVIDSLGLTNINVTGVKYVGGLSGYNLGTIENCYTTGTVKSTINNDSFTGGLVGENRGIIRNSYSNSITKGNSNNGGYVGGLVGANYGSAAIITGCYSLGSASANYIFGGLVGSNKESAKIENSYSMANASGIGSYSSIAGGLVGINTSASITNCYSTGKATATYNQGGLVGSGSTNSVLLSFWDKETSTRSTTSGGGTGLTSTEMKNVKNFLKAGWDFVNEDYNGSLDIWGINNAENNGYPFLKWQGYSCENYCEAPYNPASNIIMSNSLSSSITLESYTEAGYGAMGYAIFMNTENTWVVPSDGDEPTANATWQNSGQQCIYNGTSNNPNVTITGLDLCSGLSTYFIKVYAYNICNGSNVFETTGVLTIFTGSDNIDPVADVSILDDIVGQCSITITEAPTATDNCAGIITGTTTDPLSYTEQGTYTITWTYNDGNGNSLTQEQTVIVDDNTPPVPDVTNLDDITGQCFVTGITAPTATDNCSSAITGITSDPLSYSEQGTYTITWSYSDIQGNISTQTQKVIVNDNTNPNIICVEDQNIEISSNEEVYIVKGLEFDPTETTDNCLIASLVNDYNNSDTLKGAEFPVGTTTVIWTITDHVGNTNECSFDVTVSQATGISDMNELGISIYPNPVNDILYINCYDKTVKMITFFDITGKALLEKDNVKNEEQIDMSGFEPGIYFINIYTENETQTSRVIKK